MDDYLVISTKEEAVRTFLTTVHSEFPKFGANINPLKSKVNFDCEVTLSDGRTELVPRIYEGNILSWCGMLVDTHTLEVTPDFARILQKRISSSTNIDCTCRYEFLSLAIEASVNVGVILVCAAPVAVVVVVVVVVFVVVVWRQWWWWWEIICSTHRHMQQHKQK